MCSFDPDNVCEVWHEATHVARKDHRCGDCGRTITAGETYRRVRYIFEGDPGSSKQCAHCQTAARWLTVVCSGYSLDAVLWDLSEHLRDYGHGEPPRSSWLTRLVRYGDRRWVRRDGSLVPLADVKAWTAAAIDRVPAQMRGAA